VLELAARTTSAEAERPVALVAGACGPTAQAVAEAETARSLGYHAVLLSLGGGHWTHASDEAILAHCRAVADVLPLVGFYLQPAVGGRVLSYAFWRRFAEIPKRRCHQDRPVQSLPDARRDPGRGRVRPNSEIALYTGNDDNIVVDLLTRWQINVNGQTVSCRIVGGLLGHWAVWTRRAVEMLDAVKAARDAPQLDPIWLTRAQRVTDMNAAIFDVANNFAGCIPGIHEVLRRQGLLAGTWCLDPHEQLSPGQADEITRVCRENPDLTDDAFIAAHRDDWLR
jgi:dihydrodipicolinate synthase/N-acetylneuraminate lyase